MGEVFQASDRSSGALVAVKVLNHPHPSGAQRLEREARTLASLDHSGIVRHVAHGVEAGGEPYLVMEWLDGEDLDALLARRRLTAPEAVTLGIRVAEALGTIHARGVVHRDVKPSNIFLVDGQIERAKIIDLGLSRPFDLTQMTQPGAILGTLGYMAPEQARSDQAVDARADVFSLGCVIFRCLTGAQVFEADQMLPLLAKILFDEAPRLLDRCPDAPPELDALVNRLLRHRPEDRPQDGRAVAAALAALGSGAASPAEPPSALTDAERRMLSVVLIARPPPETRQQASTEEIASPLLGVLRAVAEAHGGRAEQLADGTIAVLITGQGVATDLAAQAARCALALHAAAPARPMALATVRSAFSERTPVSDAVARLARRIAPSSGTERDGDAAPIGIDAVTAGLLGPRFIVDFGESGPTLRGERPQPTYTLLGKQTACVGRDRELSTIEALFSECTDEPLSRAVLVTAPAGMGKSRLAQEIVHRVEARGAPLAVWVGQGDVTRAGSAFGLLRSLLAGVFGIHDGEPLEARRQKIEARVALHVPGPQQRRVADFLGELAAAPFPDAESAMLRAARQDPQFMGEQMRRAWEDFLDAECAAHPVLLVLDDLHWGDVPTVRFVDSALRRFADRPWMVIALGRPEVEELFPRLWDGRRVQRISLEALPRKACERLARMALRESHGAETIERIVTQANGHAFYLEELIRAVAEGKGDALPETVLAMVEARLAALDPEARRVLRAASIFGDVFWAGGVEALCGGSLSSTEAPRVLASLVDRELLVVRHESRFPGEPELAFRHALLREVAYAMLTEEDAVLGHRLAARWLERRGESDPLVLAEHFERGADLADAGLWYLRAAEQASRGVDTDAMVASAKRGLACDVPDPARAALLALLCCAHGWRREWIVCAQRGEELQRLAAPGSGPALIAAAAILTGSHHEGRVEAFMAAMSAGSDITPPHNAVAELAWGLSNGSYFAGFVGARADFAEALYQRLRALVSPVESHEPVARGWLYLNEGVRGTWGAITPSASLAALRASEAAFAEIDYRTGAAIIKCKVGMSLWMLGAFAEAARELEAHEDADIGMTTAFRSLCLVFALADSGELAQAHARALAMITAGEGADLALDAARGRHALAYVLFRREDFAAAEREARAALPLLAAVPLEQMAARALLSRALLALGRPAEALAAAEAAMAQYAKLHAFGFRGVLARLACAEALAATGAAARARELLLATRAHLLAEAEAIDDPELRRSFLEDVRENARVLVLTSP